MEKQTGHALRGVGGVMAHVAMRPEPLRPGAVYEGVYEGSPEKALILEVQRGGRAATVLLLGRSERTKFTNIQLAPWRLVPFPLGRWVEVRKDGRQYREWATYCPDIETAISVWLDYRERGGYQVQIFTDSTEELMLLESLGYYRPN